MSLNIGKETFIGRIINEVLPDNLYFKPYLDSETNSPKPDRHNYLGLNDLKNKDPEEELLIENIKGKRTQIKVKNLINLIIDNKW